MLEEIGALRETEPHKGTAGLPDGLFSNQKYQFGYMLEGLGMENVSIFYDHSEYLTAIWYNLCRLV
jgi:hypothetical protein